MFHAHKRTGFGTAALVLTAISCSLFAPSAPRLPNYGVFLEQGNSYVELQQYTGQPNAQSIRSQLVTTSSTPVFLVWYPQIELKYFMLVLPAHPGTGLPFKTSIKDSKNQILEITPSHPLSDGVHCFYQGDPLGNPYSLPFWCFNVNSGAASKTQPTVSPTAKAVVPSVQPTAAPGIAKQWTIRMGDLALFGVAEDGTIYAVGPKLYAVIGSDGTIKHTNQIDIECSMGGYTGGSGDVRVNEHFMVRANGTIRISCGQKAYKISPGNPPTVKAWDNVGFFPYSDKLTPLARPPAPEGYRDLWNISSLASNPYSFGSRLGYDAFYLNLDEMKGAFINHNAELVYFNLPEDVDLNRGLPGFIVTPWDDLYVSYRTYDSIGNQTGDQSVLIKPDGSSAPGGNIKGFDTYRPVYLLQQKEIYTYTGNAIKAYDLGLNYVRQYPLPQGFPAIDYTGNTNQLSIGYDGAIYVFENGRYDPSGPTLTKWAGPDTNRAANVEGQKLDADAIAFRSEVLRDLDSITSMKFVDACEAPDFANGSTSYVKVDCFGEMLPGRTHWTWLYPGGVRSEVISVGTTSCSKRNEEAWKCDTSPMYDSFRQMREILQGKPGQPGQFVVASSGSKLTSQNGVGCRIYFVEYHQDAAEWGSVYRDEICFSLDNKRPVVWNYTETATDATGAGGIVLWRDEMVSIEFNAPVSIELPAP